MKTKLLFFLLVVFLTQGRADEPALSVYDITKFDLNTGVSPELTLKVTNPSDRVLFVNGLSVTDVPHEVEILRDGKWTRVPPNRCGTGFSFRRFLPGSYLVFTILNAPLLENDVTFRVRAALYTTTDPAARTVGSPTKPYIELVSESFHSNDFHANPAVKAPRQPGIPGLELIPTPKPK